MKSDIKMIAMGCKPDPYKFTIEEWGWINGYTLILANYEGCKTFDGNKLMLLKGEFNLEEKPLETLDPHFLDENYPVVARFAPTKLGWEMLRVCALNAPHGKSLD